MGHSDADPVRLLVSNLDPEASLRAVQQSLRLCATNMVL